MIDVIREDIREVGLLNTLTGVIVFLLIIILPMICGR